MWRCAVSADTPLLLTIKEVQEATQLGRTKVYELMRDGRLPVVRIGRTIRVRREALERWLESLEEGGLEPWRARR